ncbi:MAG TPA: ribosome small subunit-dependent GTPase A [Bacillota bacterium]|nr:ribosome small subunit-dependent GTPase A [Bacillota bacterium]
MEAEGRIVKALSGFYYVKSGETIFPCKGRGVFRKRKITPLVGDFVTFEHDHHREGYIMEVHRRTNQLVRPPIANVTQAMIVSSVVQPKFSSLLLDRFLTLIEHQSMTPIIILTKTDLLSEEERANIEQFKEDYEQIGYHVEFFSSTSPTNINAIKRYCENEVTVLAGQSGVGKSTLLNTLKPSLQLKTADISGSLGRGKHTTRHVELVEINGGLVADTPGFSALQFDEIELQELTDCFPEFRKRKGECRFRACMHYKEPGCKIKKAVQEEQIKTYRYEHYVKFFEEIQSRKPRYS